jgi:serine/threonine-protein phosphatase Stp1
MLHSGRWRSAARTDPGKVRSRNEDAYLECPEQGIWAVADGMGGHSGGDMASQLVVANLA